MKTFKIRLSRQARAITVDGEVTYTWIPHGGKSDPQTLINHLMAFCRDNDIEMTVEEQDAP